MHGLLLHQHIDRHLCSELGAIGYMLNFTREWVLATLPSPHHVLEILSERFSVAAAQLGLRHVPRLFDEHHGTITGMHYRTLAQVVAVITHDYIPPASVMGTVIAATVDWYWACRAPKFSPADIAALDVKCTALQQAWAALDTPEWRLTTRAAEERNLPKRCVLLTTKFHRAIEHCADYVREWGPIEALTTETSESLHKQLKVFFRT